jgi:hypothetical protein
MGVEFPCEQTLEVGIILILKEIILMGDEIEAFRDFHYFLACMGVGIEACRDYHYSLACMGVGIEASRDFHYFLACMGVGFYFVLIREKIVLEHPTTSINS